MDNGQSHRRSASGVVDPAGEASRRRRATLHDVATAAGVSVTTVSRALAGYDDVAETTRLRVRDLAQQLGYRPSIRARNLAMGRQATLRCAVVSLGMSPSDLPHTVYGPILAGILAGAGVEEMDIHLAQIDKRSPAEELARFLAEDRADGIVLLTAMPLRPDDVVPLERSGVPYVLVNRHFDHYPNAPEVNCVIADWVEATRDAVRRLHRLGHQRMAALFPRSPSVTSTALDHERGWRETLAECGLTATQAPVLHPVTYVGDEATGYELGRRLLTQGLPDTGERPTAIVGYNDRFAQGVIRAARDLGVTIPDQLSVIGFDNSIGQYLWPPLCTYDPHLYTIGEQAALLLGSLLRSDDPSSAPQRVVLPLDYICRETCAPAPTNIGE